VGLDVLLEESGTYHGQKQLWGTYEYSINTFEEDLKGRILDAAGVNEARVAGETLELRSWEPCPTHLGFGRAASKGRVRGGKECQVRAELLNGFGNCRTGLD
jgi:hypothetical protein